MPVVPLCSDSAGSIVGVTQAFCIYKVNGTGTLAVANWRDMALGNVCPAKPLLPGDVTENDRRNWSATVLRELLGLKSFGLTPAQAATYDELVACLCGNDVE